MFYLFLVSSCCLCSVESCHNHGVSSAAAAAAAMYRRPLGAPDSAVLADAPDVEEEEEDDEDCDCGEELEVEVEDEAGETVVAARVDEADAVLADEEEEGVEEDASLLVEAEQRPVRVASEAAEARAAGVEPQLT